MLSIKFLMKDNRNLFRKSDFVTKKVPNVSNYNPNIS